MAIDNLIANHPARHKPPLLDALNKEVENAKIRANSSRMQGNALSNVLGSLKESEYSKADPEFVHACVKTANDYFTGKISKAVFDEACDELEKIANSIARSNRSVCSERKALAYKD